MINLLQVRIQPPEASGLCARNQRLLLLRPGSGGDGCDLRQHRLHRCHRPQRLSGGHLERQVREGGQAAEEGYQPADSVHRQPAEPGSLTSPPLPRAGALPATWQQRAGTRNPEALPVLAGAPTADATAANTATAAVVPAPTSATAVPTANAISDLSSTHTGTVSADAVATTRTATTSDDATTAATTTDDATTAATATTLCTIGCILSNYLDF